MMLRAMHANDVVPAAQMKKSKSFDLDFLCLELEMTTICFIQLVAKAILHALYLNFNLLKSFLLMKDMRLLQISNHRATNSNYCYKNQLFGNIKHP